MDHSEMPRIVLFDNYDKILLSKNNDFIALSNLKDSLNFDAIEFSSNHGKFHTCILPKDLFDNIAIKFEKDFFAVSVRKFLINTTIENAEVVSKARQLAFWHYNHKFCGRCGAINGCLETEFAKKCTACGYSVYPRITPCVLAAVMKDDMVLLGRAYHFPPGVYSLLAGFIEVAETCEQTVAREVFEESGIKISNIKYYGSQSWPFPHSLMLAYTAEYESGEIVVDKNELEDVRWFSLESLRTCPELLPPNASLSRMLLNDLINGSFTS